jgi:ABC-type maltose transport system permease subunit
MRHTAQNTLNWIIAAITATITVVISIYLIMCLIRLRHARRQEMDVTLLTFTTVTNGGEKQMIINQRMTKVINHLDDDTILPTFGDPTPRLLPFRRSVSTGQLNRLGV